MLSTVLEYKYSEKKPVNCGTYAVLQHTHTEEKQAKMVNCGIYCSIWYANTNTKTVT